MNKKITIFSLALLALVSGFMSANAAEPKKKELSKVEKFKLVTKEVAKDVYNNSLSLAVDSTILAWIGIGAWHGFKHLATLDPALVNFGVADEAVLGKLKYLILFSNAMYALTAFKYCASDSMDYGFSAALIAGCACLLRKRFLLNPSVNISPFEQAALAVAVAKCAICIGRKGHEYINSKLEESKKKDVAQEAGLVVA